MLEINKKIFFKFCFIAEISYKLTKNIRTSSKINLFKILKIKKYIGVI